MKLLEFEKITMSYKQYSKIQEQLDRIPHLEKAYGDFRNYVISIVGLLSEVGYSVEGDDIEFRKKLINGVPPEFKIDRRNRKISL